MKIATEVLNKLVEISKDQRGVTRESYGDREHEAHRLVREAAQQLDLDTSVDAAGNLYFTLKGQDTNAPGWLTGSHLDSVKEGGNFDGAAGVVAALAAIDAIRQSGATPESNITGVAFRCEESSSWFVGRHKGYLGSRAALGLLEDHELTSATHVLTNRTLSQSIDDAGFDSKRIKFGTPLIDLACYGAFLEAHIEQGPLLENAAIPVGMVTSIRGAVRGRQVTCRGAYAHSGATPSELRKDAVSGFIEVAYRLGLFAKEMRVVGRDAVVTFGRVHTENGIDSLAKVPGKVEFTIDFRSGDPDVISMAYRYLKSIAAEAERQLNVSFDLSDVVVNEPAVMSSGVREDLCRVASQRKVEFVEMPCGAGHDALHFANRGVPTAMILIRNKGGSHNPDEDMRIEDLSHAVAIMAAVMSHSPSVAVGSQK